MVRLRKGERKLQKLVPSPKWKWNFSKEFKEFMKQREKEMQLQLMWSIMIQDRD